jgi:hypothetical protein
MKSLALLLLAGCLEVPNPPMGMCTTNADCAAGEACQEGTCWGDPPSGTFAATLGPPNGRNDLVSAENPSLAIPIDGWLGDLVMPAPVTLSGRVEAYCPASSNCDQASLGATITITRPSLFPGGPGFRAVFAAKDGISVGTDSWSASLPQSQLDDPDYVITVLPDGRGDQPPPTGTSPAMVAPPLRMTSAAMQSKPLSFTLGSAYSKTISGTLTDGQLTPHPLSKYRVVALGRWDATSPLTEVSTVAYVGSVQPSDGSFTLTIADGVVGPVEISATPYDPSVVAPALYLPNITPGDGQTTLTQPNNLGNRVDVAIPIVGQASGGEIQPISGARVIVTARFDPSISGTHAVLSADVTTGDDGIAHISLLDGGTFHDGYLLRVIPPASSPLGVVFDQPVVLGAIVGGSVTQPPVRLPKRVALSGTVVDSAGNVLANVSVTARPSLRFTWGLDSDGQQFLAEIPAATTVTPDDGGFSVSVDPFIGEVWGTYDLTLEPPTGSHAPSWTVADIQLPRVPNETQLSVDQIVVPAPAYIHGRIADSGGGDVLGGELRIFAIITDLSLCDQVAHPPATCVLPAQLMAHGTSADHGIVQLTLPRP